MDGGYDTERYPAFGEDTHRAPTLSLFHYLWFFAKSALHIHIGRLHLTTAAFDYDVEEGRKGCVYTVHLVFALHLSQLGLSHWGSRFLLVTSP